MPSRNIARVDVSDSFYHIYARGHSREKIFLEQADYATFLNLFKRYLSVEQQHDRIGVPYPHYYQAIELVCFCLMPNHFHLLIYQRDAGSLQKLMKSVMTSYVRYFNKKYGHSGALFESRYKASLITNDSYLQHITRYIHLNRKDWEKSPYSSIDFYLGGRQADWIVPNRVMQLFNGPADYRRFMLDYEDQKQMLDEIKYELANSNNTTT